MMAKGLFYEVYFMKYFKISCKIKYFYLQQIILVVGSSAVLKSTFVAYMFPTVLYHIHVITNKSFISNALS